MSQAILHKGIYEIRMAGLKKKDSAETRDRTRDL